MDKFIDFRFLNQVDGLLPEIFKSKTAQYPERINKYDNCYEQSNQGCDQWVVPQGAEFPTLSMPTRPMVKDISDISIIPSHFLSNKRK